MEVMGENYENNNYGKKYRKHQHREHGAGSLFWACVLIGIGIGFIIHSFKEGLVIGAGTGFIAMGMYYIFNKM